MTTAGTCGAVASRGGGGQQVEEPGALETEDTVRSQFAAHVMGCDVIA